MSRIAIFPYGVSDSATLLRNALRVEFPQRTVIKLRTQQPSTYTGRAGDMMINWGRSDIVPRTSGRATVVNSALSVACASNKIVAFDTMVAAGVNCVERTTLLTVAQSWKEEGATVFARTLTRSHSGAGIRVFANETPQDLGDVNFSTGNVCSAPLYTKGLMGRHREFRIHVFKGQVIFIQLKKRRNGHQELESYSNVVRNHGNGWIYASAPETNQPPISAFTNAILAVESLGLDFGAVDVMTNNDEAYVLEVNTAPGLSGTTTRERYVRAFSELLSGNSITDCRSQIIIPAGVTNSDQSQETTRQAATQTSTPASRPSTPRPAQAASASHTSGLVDEAFYVITYEETRMVAQWSAGISSFQLCGFDMPISASDVEAHNQVSLGE